MPGQKRKLNELEDIEGASNYPPSKRQKPTMLERENLSKFTMNILGSEKIYDTVDFVSNTDFKKYSETESIESPETKNGRPKRIGKVKEPRALRELGDGTKVLFDTGFVLQRDGDQYTCTCDVFHDKVVDVTKTSCQHLEEFLGYEFENRRVSKKVGAIPKHKTVQVLLAHKYEEGEINPQGWWLSEKLDGVRAFWDGKCFYSRLGNAFLAPSYFTKDLPTDMTLDGELFGGRGQFQDTVRVVKSGPDADWSNIKYHIFDCPSMADQPFETRMNAVIAMFGRKRPGHAVFVEQFKCNSVDHLNESCDKVLSLGGEGIMLREPGSIYEGIRSRTLLKMKKFYDAEAVVIGHESGKGNNTFKCGALRCRMECGKEFSVGSGLTNKDRNNPPKIGSIITYKFQELTKSGAPRFPSYIGIRIDMTSPKDAVIREVIES